ncbi:MAG: DUF2958 domain-containing protein [Christensenellaceae bacterium]|nr:DUF2958 domain-containing protein [Christensenellaceae bacterium]
MRLINNNIVNKFRKHPRGSQKELGMDAIVLVKYFFKSGLATWLITETTEVDGDWLVYGYCQIIRWRWGSVRLSELAGLTDHLGQSVIRDITIGENSTVKDLVVYRDEREGF